MSDNRSRPETTASKKPHGFFTSLPAGRRVSLAGAFQAYAGYGLGTWLPAFFIRLHGMTPGELGLWLSWITALGGGLGAFSGGWLADRWVYRQPRARAYVGMIGAILAVPFLIGGFILSDTRLALLCFLPANFFGTLWAWSLRLYCPRPRPSSDAGDGLSRVYFYYNDHRAECRTANNRYHERSDRHSGGHPSFSAMDGGYHESGLSRLFLVDSTDDGG